MGDTIPFFENEIKDAMQGIIKVVGVGGGGCNAVRNMYNDGVVGVTYAVCNTDSQSLSRSPVPVKILLGKSGCSSCGGWCRQGYGYPDGRSRDDSLLFREEA